MTYWTTKGSVRGRCGHQHRTIRTAVECLIRDQGSCAGLVGGRSYSDRTVVHVIDGSEVPLTDAERDQVAGEIEYQRYGS